MLQLRGQLARKVRETMACYRYQSWCRYIQFLNSVGSRQHKLKINSVLSWSAPELVSRPILRTRCDELQNQGDPHRLRKKNDEVVSRMVSLANRGDAIERDHKRKSRDSQMLQSQPGQENLYSKEPASVNPSLSLVYAQLSISLYQCDLYQVNGPHEAERL